MSLVWAVGEESENAPDVFKLVGSKGHSWNERFAELKVAERPSSDAMKWDAAFRT